MKRRELLKILNQNYCELKRHGSNHDIYINTINNKTSPVPRHNEIKRLPLQINFSAIRY